MKGELAMTTLDGVIPYPPEFAQRYRALGYWEDRTLGQWFDETCARFFERARCAVMTSGAFDTASSRES